MSSQFFYIDISSITHWINFPLDVSIGCPMSMCDKRWMFYCSTLIQNQRICYALQSINAYCINDRCPLIWFANCGTSHRIGRKWYAVIKSILSVVLFLLPLLREISLMKRSKTFPDWDKFKLKTLWIKHAECEWTIQNNRKQMNKWKCSRLLYCGIHLIPLMTIIFINQYKCKCAHWTHSYK